MLDGKAAVVVLENGKKYASLPVPDTIDGMMQVVMGHFGVDFPLGDFLTNAPDKAFLTGVTAGREVGSATIDGVPCHHLVFSQPPGIELELWLEANEQSLPRRFLVIYRSLPGEPNFIAESLRLEFHRPSAGFGFPVRTAGSAASTSLVPSSRREQSDKSAGCLRYRRFPWTGEPAPDPFGSGSGRVALWRSRLSRSVRRSRSARSQWWRRGSWSIWRSRSARSLWRSRGSWSLWRRRRAPPLMAAEPSYYVRGVRPWVAAPYYGAVVAGVALGAIIATTAVPPAPSLSSAGSGPAQLKIKAIGTTVPDERSRSGRLVEVDRRSSVPIFSTLFHSAVHADRLPEMRC